MEQEVSDTLNPKVNVTQVNEAPIDVHFWIAIHAFDGCKTRYKEELVNDVRIVNPIFILTSGNHNKSLLILNDNKVIFDLPVESNFPYGLIECLNSLSGSEPKELTEAYSLAGLRFQDKQNIIFTVHPTSRNIYIKLIIHKDTATKTVKSVLLHFCNPDDDRISSVKQLYNNNLNTKAYLNGMQVGPSANYAPEDEMVMRNINCRYCGKLIAVMSNYEYFQRFRKEDICDECKDISAKNTYKEETRNYSITRLPEQLDTLDVLFAEINSLCSAGSSRAIKIYIDGDGALDFSISGSKPLSKKAAGFGTLEKDADGRLKYLDLG